MRSTRDIIVDHLLNDRESEILSIIEKDPFAQHIYEEEKLIFLIEKYLDDDISEQDRKIVEDSIEENPGFRLEFNLRKAVNNSLKDVELHNDLEEAWGSYTQERLRTNEGNEKSVILNKPKRYIKWIAAASIILLLSGSMFLVRQLQPVSSNELFAEYYTPLENVEGTSFDANNTNLNRARQFYHNENYLDALRILRTLPDSPVNHIEKHFFSGLTMLELGMYNAAIKSFELVVQTESSECLPQSFWYLALCYIKTEQEDRAEEILKLIKENQSYNYTQAVRILRKL